MVAIVVARERILMRLVFAARATVGGGAVGFDAWGVQWPPLPPASCSLSIFHCTTQAKPSQPLASVSRRVAPIQGIFPEN